MSVAVVIGTMDRADQLARCLASLYDNTVRPDEVIVVDGSKQPETRAVVEAMAAEQPGLRYIKQETRGLSSARNIGMQAAGTDFILTTDDDCLAHREWIATMLATLTAADQPDAVCGRCLPYGDFTRKLLVAVNSGDGRRVFKGKAAPWKVGISVNIGFRRALFRDVAGYDIRLGPGSPLRTAEDLDLVYSILKAGKTIVYTPDAIVYHDQWRSREEARQRRWEYAFGGAAMLTKHVREDGDLFALRLLTVRFLDEAPLLAIRGVLKGSKESVILSWQNLRGSLSGIRRAWTTFGRRPAGPALLTPERTER
ncbi:MAG: glycosyltransferase [Chloroflexi bacterium]|nr:glycosyltransferase [Chloroflexota bacterium]